MTPETGVRIRDLAAEGRSITAISLATGVAPRTVRALLDRSPNYQERVAADRLAGWEPLCMDAEDWSDWQRMNTRIINEGDKAVRPCTDCPMAFAAEMRALNKCNGTPGWRPPADDYEEADVGDAITISNVTIDAPCGGCAHRDVCSIRATLGGLSEADVTIPKPDPALTVGLALTVECSHFMRAKGGKGSVPGRKLNLSEEERQRRADSARAMTAANKATPTTETATT